ncbi:hypothetical protein BpHYR1_036132 [Brachionus plicatilis]|uniref:Uncharacterized protein n=1 Tax=Brachionus plicatilis TaxID=10195 RepID=A0A3M7S616_BRAPC|nr:hypothetical protein BpHYR1_036132 [Brachionus plicatilis]
MKRLLTPPIAKNPFTIQNLSNFDFNFGLCKLKGKEINYYSAFIKGPESAKLISLCKLTIFDN